MRCDFLVPPIAGFILVQKYLGFNHMGKKAFPHDWETPF